jgi:hypothetical protein
MRSRVLETDLGKQQLPVTQELTAGNVAEEELVIR